MPKRRADNLLEQAYAALVAALRRARVPFMTIGGVAVIAHGVKRLTTDVDAVVRGDAVGVEALVRSFARFDIVPRIPEAVAFARENLVLLLTHAPTGVDLDVSFAWTRFELEALAACRTVRFGRVSAPMARPEDLVIFKALAARPKDVNDATALLVLHRDIDLARVRARVTELASMADEPALLQVLDAIIAASVAARPGAKGSPRRRQTSTTATRARKAAPSKRRRKRSTRR